MKHLVLLSLLLASAAFSEPVKQSHVKQHGDLKIFYSAFHSSFLTPDIAVANNFVRGKDRGELAQTTEKFLALGARLAAGAHEPYLREVLAPARR